MQWLTASFMHFIFEVLNLYKCYINGKLKLIEKRYTIVLRKTYRSSSFFMKTIFMYETFMNFWTVEVLILTISVIFRCVWTFLKGRNTKSHTSKVVRELIWISVHLTLDEEFNKKHTQRNMKNGTLKEAVSRKWGNSCRKNQWGNSIKSVRNPSFIQFIRKHNNNHKLFLGAIYNWSFLLDFMWFSSWKSFITWKQ